MYLIQIELNLSYHTNVKLGKLFTIKSYRFVSLGLEVLSQNGNMFQHNAKKEEVSLY